MNQIARSFVFVALVVAILLALHFLPKMTIGETELRRVNILSDILPEYLEDGDGLGFIPDVPEPPKPIVTDDESSDAYILCGFKRLFLRAMA